MASEDRKKALLEIDIESPKLDKTIDQLAVLRQKISAIEKEQKSLDKTTKEGSLAFENNRLVLRKLNSEYNALAKTVGKTSYWSKFKDAATTALGSTGVKLKSLYQMFLTNPIGLAVTSLVAAFKTLRDAFLLNDSAMTNWQASLANFRQLISPITKAIDSIAEAAGRAIRSISEFGTRFGQAFGIISQNAQSAGKLIDQLERLEDLGRVQSVRGARLSKQISELTTTMRDSTQSDEKRLDAANRIIDLTKQQITAEATSSAQVFSKQFELALTDGLKLDDASIKTIRNRLSQLIENPFSEASLSRLDETMDFITKNIGGKNADEWLNRFRDFFTQRYQLLETYNNNVRRATNEAAQLAQSIQDNQAEADAAAATAAKNEKDKLDKEAAEAEAKLKALQDKIKSFYDTISDSVITAEEKELSEALAPYNGIIWEAFVEMQKLDQEKDKIFIDQLNRVIAEAQKAAEKTSVKILEEQAARRRSVRDKELQEEQQLATLKAQNTDKTEKEILDIQLHYLDQRLALYDKDSIQYQQLLATKLKLTADFCSKNEAEAAKHQDELFNIFKQGFEAFNGIVDVFSNISNTLSSIENAELERYRSNQETRQKILEKRLDQGLISQRNYEAEVEALQEEADAKSKKIEYEQAKRAKALSVAQATISFASATVAAVEGALKAAAATGPAAVVTAPIFTAILTSLAATTAGAALATAIATPLPKYGNGGVISGPSHERGGVRANTPSGTVELEGGEMIVNKFATAKYRPLLESLNQYGQRNKFGKGRYGNGGVLDGNYGLRNSSLNASKSQPIYVTVEDINRGQSNYARVVNTRNL